MIACQASRTPSAPEEAPSRRRREPAHAPQKVVLANGAPQRGASAALAGSRGAMYKTLRLVFPLGERSPIELLWYTSIKT